MDRIKAGGYSALIEAAYAIIPHGLHGRLRPDFLCGSDPVFAGLHGYALTSDGRAYAATAHAVYPFHQTGLAKSMRRTTVVLPTVDSVGTVVHELGHVLHESLGFAPSAEAVTRYGQTNRYEAFAEAFTAWLVPAGGGYEAAHQYLLAHDPATVALLESLAA